MISPALRPRSGRFLRSVTGSAILAGLLLSTGSGFADAPKESKPGTAGLFARDNLVAWCIVPFDSKRRGPEERAAVLERLGFKRFAYDWRAEHVSTFDAEVEALKRHGVALSAFWVAPGELNADSRRILDVLKRHEVKADLWALLDLGPDVVTGAEQARRVELAAAKLRPLAEAAGAIGCRVGLYNHGGWFGEPENQLAIIERLEKDGVKDVGMVYNLHHGHDHLGRFPAILAKIRPRLFALNLNGMDRGGDKVGRKILPLGQGACDLELLKTIRDSGYRGPIGILGHTMDDAEERLRDNLDGLDWLVPQLDGASAGPKPRPRTPVPPPIGPKGRIVEAAGLSSKDVEGLAKLVADAKASGDPRRGAEVFASTKFGCLTCHKVGTEGGAIGPDLTIAGACSTPEFLAESLLWPARQVREGYAAFVVETKDGRVIQGAKQGETPDGFTLRDPATGELVRVAKADVESAREQGTLMPDGLLAAMTPDQRRDLVRFLIDLGRPGGPKITAGVGHAHVAPTFPFDRKPLHPEEWPSWEIPVNRDRLYDFYTKEAAYFAKAATVPSLLPAYPGIDGGTYGHWGNQNEDVWVDLRWNDADLGSLLSGVFRGADATVPKGVCVRLGDRGELAACFNPETLRYEALWRDGFVKFSKIRHGFLDGLLLQGNPLPRPESQRSDKPFAYRGFYRHGRRMVFAYRVGDEEMLDAPWVEDGKFTRVVAPAKDHPLAGLTRGGPAQWPQIIETRGTLGEGRPYAVDNIEPPFKNPWNAPLFFGDHDFLPDGSAMICTMQGDVWHVTGLDASLDKVRWRRFASGLHQALGLLVVEGKVHVLGRDQITRLHDLNGDGEADFYECVSNAYATSTAGHDFICGLQRDKAGDFYTTSGKQGVIRISPDGRTVETLATGLRNADGTCLTPEGTVTAPSSEGEWTPASMICEVRRGAHYGYNGPKDGRPPDLPLVYLPRGMDNSSGSQVFVPDDRWGPLRGQMIHFSYGAGAHFLVLRDRVDGQPQGVVVPLVGEFLSGVHRGRFSPKDGQLYACGMGGWGTYTARDGCFQRVRYTGDPVQLPDALHVHENGVLVRFTRPIDRAVAEGAKGHFAQAWNYRYAAAYGSPELSTRHPGTPGHDPIAIRSATVLADGRTLFLELPDLQPVSQLHLHLQVDSGRPHDLVATVHKLAAPFTGIPGYRPVAKTIAAHPLLADLALAAKTVPNPWRKKLPGAKAIRVEAGKNLTFSPRSITVKAGEPIAITFVNPDVVPHNWALVRPGALPRVGDLANKIIADPDAFARHYIPATDDVLAYTDMVHPGELFTISLKAPDKPGRYPYLCTFPATGWS